jgi:hypothetical protein
MLESGSSGSVRGASSNGRPYREPRPFVAFKIGTANGREPRGSGLRLEASVASSADLVRSGLATWHCRLAIISIVIEITARPVWLEYPL